MWVNCCCLKKIFLSVNSQDYYKSCGCTQCACVHGWGQTWKFLTQPLAVCCCFISHTSPEQVQPILLWQISQASPDVMDFSSAPQIFSSIHVRPVSNVHFGLQGKILHQDQRVFWSWSCWKKKQQRRKPSFAADYFSFKILTYPSVFMIPSTMIRFPSPQHYTPTNMLHCGDGVLGLYTSAVFLQTSAACL